MAGETGIALAATAAGGEQARRSAGARLEPGSLAGDYEIVQLLGAGAMGEVYEGRHPVIKKRVAIKVIKHVLAESEEAALRFIREAQAVNQVEHPNVVDVFAFGRLSDGRLYLAMDFLEGMSLGDHLRKHGALGMDEFFRVMKEICSALAAAHEQGIIHRDLKPDNVFLAKDGGVFVLDFGVAKILHNAAAEAGEATLTGEGVWIGTPAYMAPEQWTAEGASVASDVYSLGAMAFEMLTGSVPYKADSVPGIMQMHFNAAPPPLRTGGGKLPRRIEDTIAAALAKEPSERFDGAESFWQALTGDLKVKRPAFAAELEGKGRGGAVMMIAGGAVALAAAGGVFYVVSQPKTEREEPRPVANRAGDESPAEEGVKGPHTEVTSQPSGAMLLIGGRPAGRTPHILRGEEDQVVTIKLRKPGYLASVAEVRIGAEPIRVELPPVRGFEGLWLTPEGKLRQFRRHEGKVVASKLASADAQPEFYRDFHFVAGDDAESGWVVFEASAPLVHEPLENEPSCRWDLPAQYRFDPSTDKMQSRRMELSFNVVGGRCVVQGKKWSEHEEVKRMGGAAFDNMVAHSDALMSRVETKAAPRGKNLKNERALNRPNRRRRTRNAVGGSSDAPAQQQTLQSDFAKGADPGIVTDRNADDALAPTKKPVRKVPSDEQRAAQRAAAKKQAAQEQAKKARRKKVKTPVQRRSKLPQAPTEKRPPIQQQKK